MNRALFDELSMEHPNIARIHALLHSGADINALVKMRDSHLTAYWYMEGGIGKHKYWQNILHSWDTVGMDAKLAAFKAHYYPLLDVLETYDFNIMNGASFRLEADGTKRLQQHAGFRFMDLAEFQILAKYDVARLVQFFERMYFNKGHSVDDTSVIGSLSYLSPLLWTVSESYKPAVILYFLMKGARWNNPAWRQPGYEARITNFATQVPVDAAAAMIAKLQQQLGVNYIVGPQGANLRGFLAAAYGTVAAVGILQKAIGISAKQRRNAILLLRI